MNNVLKKERFLLLTMLIGGLCVLGILTILHINQGSVKLNYNMIIESIFSPRDIIEHHIVRHLRLTRLTIGIIAGAGLGVSGVLFQSLMRNPLASATTLGINAGAYFTVIFFAVFIPSNMVEVAFLPSFLGAVGTAAIVYYLSGGRKVNPIQMALAGVSVSLVFSSMTAALQILFTNETSGLFLWGSGSLAQSSWIGTQFVFPIVLICLISALIISSKLDVLLLGDDVATSLGVNIIFYRNTGILIGVLFTSAIITVVGPIGFVGLIAPHIMKQLGFKKHGHLIILSLIWGSVILVGADVLSRLFTMSSYELPVGAFTALFGAPWIIYLAYKTGKRFTNSSQGLIIDTQAKKYSYKLLIVTIVVLIIITLIISLRFGGQEYSFKEIISILLGKGDTVSNLIINQIRLPRILTALLAGVVLGISGFLLQTVLKNPLADPSILGVTPGAALGALMFLYFIPSASKYLIAISAFFGAVIISAAIFMISRKSKFNPPMLVLVGMAVTALCSAGITIIIVNTKVGKAASLVWLAGSTYASSWSDVIVLTVTLVLLFPLSWLLGKDLDSMILGDEVAVGIGTDVIRVRVLASLIGILLAAVAVSTVGTVGFIGLLAPHMSRLLAGLKHRKTIIITALMGGLILLISDYIGKMVIYPNEVPSGLVVAVIGGPYFLWLMYSMSKTRR